MTAIQDAVALANSLYDIKCQSYQGVKEALQEFRDERYSKVKDQYEASKLNAKLLYGKVKNITTSQTYSCSAVCLNDTNVDVSKTLA